MCGIIGVCSADAAARNRVPELCRHLAARGPDAQGAWDDDTVVLGHRRLSILDRTERSDQPAVDSSGRWVLSYNGEVYDFRSLTEPACASDTLALLADPVAALEPGRLRGMFAYALWDATGRELQLVRDRFGIKPLYTARTGDGLGFSSTARTTAAVVGTSALDRQGVADFLRYGSLQGPRSVYAQVGEVEPGTRLRCRDGVTTSERWWDYPGAPAPDGPTDLEEVLRDAVAAHTVSDVPVAVFLSAGVDSTLVAALGRELGIDLHAVTVTLPGSDLDEGAAAATTARLLGLPHDQVEVQADDVDFDAFFAAMDQPSIDGLNTFLVAGAARRLGVRVALSGLGADEVFAGYDLFRQVPAAALAARVVPASVRARVLRGRSQDKLPEVLAAGSDVRALHDVVRALFPVADVEALTGVPLRPREQHLSARGPVDRLTELEVSGYLRNTLLRDADVYGMAHSVEIRTPFVDHLVLAAALSQGQLARWRHGKQGLKALLSARGLDHVVARRKTGFSLPYAQFLDGPLRARVAALPDGPLDQVLEPRALSRLVGPASAGRQAPVRLAPMRLWALVVLDAWLRRHAAEHGALVLEPAAADASTAAQGAR